MEMVTITALIALAAVVVGPVIQLQIAKRQIRAQLVSANRQKWVDALREELGKFCSLMLFVSQNVGNREQSVSASAEIFQIETRLKLRLNPDEPDHSTLLRTLNEALVHTGKAFKLFEDASEEGAKRREEYGPKTREYFDQIVAAARPVLKQAWKKVKQGK